MIENYRYGLDARRVECAYSDIFVDAIIRMYFWVALGLILTGGVAWASYQSGFILMEGVGLWGVLGLFAAQIGLIFAITYAAHKSVPIAVALYILFAVVEGAVLSYIFGIYTPIDIWLAFILTAALFGAMSVIGFTTKKDLSGFGSVLVIGLFGVIGASVVNLFIGSSMIMWLVTIAALPIFLGLAVYETKSVKEMAMEAAYSGDAAAAPRISILGAVGLYLIIINLFLILLRIVSFFRG